jgi:hypothetical protein
MQSHTDDVLSDEMVMDKALLDETWNPNLDP